MTPSRIIAPWHAFLLTFLLVWLPWLAWFALRAYVLGQPDSKFGRDWGFLFGAVVWGAAAFLSATVALVVHRVESRSVLALSSRQREVALLLGGVTLAAIGTWLPEIAVPLPESVPEPYASLFGYGVPWVLISAVIVLFAIGSVKWVRNLTAR